MVGTVLQCHTKMENSERFTRHYYEHRSVDDSKNIEFPNLSGLIKDIVKALRNHSLYHAIKRRMISFQGRHDKYKKQTKHHS